MVDGNIAYSRQMFNESGYILMYPNIGENSDLLQSVPPNPYAESASQLFPLGTKLIQAERVWRYCKCGATQLYISRPIQSAAQVHAEMNNDIVVGAAAAIGDYTVVLTSTTNLAAAPLSSTNGLAEGYLLVNDAAGEGQCYKIKSSVAFASTSATAIVLYDPLTIALTTASQCAVIQNPYANVIQTTAVVTGMCVGIPGIAVTAAYYFWSQTGGPAGCFATNTIAQGTTAVVGTTAGKADPAAAVTTEIAIGYPLTPMETTDDEYFIVFLTLDT